MTRAGAFAVAMALSALLGAAPALAQRQVYTYFIMHPLYGQIGTLTDRLDRSPEGMRITARLRITVELLGIVVYRQDTDTIEIMRGNRLMSLESVSNKDGQHAEVHGEVRGDRFTVNATGGLFSGPATTFPSDPWVLTRTGAATIVYTDTGRIAKVYISGGDHSAAFANGTLVSARHFIVMGDKRQEVWLDDRGVPIMFRSIEDGTPIDFVLQNATQVAGVVLVAPSKRLVLAMPERGR
jgi:hypothetical protein